MAKQSFTTGQVLTAAQMTSLQQTAMGGGSATAKTANYVLVAADAGTTVAMNSSGATTITVNTSIFSAGDTVTIQNLGSGVCTITAGTATVNTSATLALAQYEGGQLYFVSASAAIFFKAGAAGGGGKVLQAVNATYSTTTTIASTTKTDTGLSASITPSATSSKILVLVSQHVWVGRNSERVNGGGLYLLRGSTEIWNGSDQLSWHNFGAGFMQYGTFWTLHYYDSPSTTSSTTYKTQGDSWIATDGGSIIFQQNSVTSSMTLLEIGA